MFVATNRVPVLPERAQDFESAFLEGAPLMKDAKGLVAFYLMRPADAKSPYLAMSLWEGKDDYEAWLQSEGFRQTHAPRQSLEGAFSGPPALEIHDVVQVISSSHPR